MKKELFSEEEKNEFLTKRNTLLKDLRYQTWIKGTLAFFCGAAIGRTAVGLNSYLQIIKVKKNSPTLTAFPLLFGCFMSFLISLGHLDNHIHDLEYFVYEKYVKTENRKEELKQKAQESP